MLSKNNPETQYEPVTIKALLLAYTALGLTNEEICLRLTQISLLMNEADLNGNGRAENPVINLYTGQKFAKNVGEFRLPRITYGSPQEHYVFILLRDASLSNFVVSLERPLTHAESLSDGRPLTRNDAGAIAIVTVVENNALVGLLEKKSTEETSTLLGKLAERPGNLSGSTYP